VLVDSGAAADPGYIDGMLARELQTSTFLGAGVSIPHGTNEARAHIKAAALGFLQFPGGIDWDGQTAYVVIPIASNSDEHVGILSALASTLARQDQVREVAHGDERGRGPRPADTRRRGVMHHHEGTEVLRTR
jgi:PTS system mannitol-specific IIC component